MTNTMRKSLKVNTNHTGESKVDLGRFLVVLGESVADLGSPWKLLQFACNVQGNDRMDDVEIETVFIDADPIQKCSMFFFMVRHVQIALIHSKYTSNK